MVLAEVIIICQMLSLPIKCIDKYVIKKSVPAMAAIYGTYTNDNVYMQLQNNDAASVVNYIDEPKLLQQSSMNYLTRVSIRKGFHDTM